MLLLRLTSLALGAVTSAAFVVLARFVVGIPVLTALGSRAGVPRAGLPEVPVAAALVAAAAAGGAVTGWTAPGRPVLHALGLAVPGAGVLALVAVLGPPGGPGLAAAGLFFAAVVVGGWIAARLAGEGDRSPPVGRTGTGEPDR